MAQTARKPRSEDPDRGACHWYEESRSSFARAANSPQGEQLSATTLTRAGRPAPRKESRPVQTLRVAFLSRFRLGPLTLGLARRFRDHAQCRHVEVCLRPLALDDGLARPEGVRESEQSHFRLYARTSTRVDGRKARPRACLQREVPGTQERDTRHAATGDAVKVETLELEAQGLDGTLRRTLGRLDVVEALGAMEIDKDRSPCSVYASIDDRTRNRVLHFRVELSARVIFLLGGA
ncbi:hypothetical protein HYPGJ_31391 [Hyphomicrobium sp. GJ21]|nr:hypothetical protein HYPGJ_31391 [Hyphomicrobium sp. GJ21]